MRVPILMPQLGESIAEATVVEIDISAGSDVAADQEIFQVETNKAMMGVTTPCAGKILEIVAEAGASYAVGATLAFLEAEEEEARRSGLAPIAPPESVAPGYVPASAADAMTSDAAAQNDRPHFAVDPADQIDTSSSEQPQVRPTISGLPVPATASGASYLSPRLKARMEDFGLNAADLAGVAGSGAGGRVTVEDFEKFIREIEQRKITAASPMRIAVADSMRRSWTRPLATVGSPIRLDALLAHRRECDPKPGIALYVIRALAVALAENTAIAGRLIGDRIIHPDSIDIGFAVEVADGVLVPVMKSLDGLTLAELTRPYEKLVRQARDRKLPPEATGTGIATVTNFGTFGIVWATPIPLPEQNLVLGLGAGRKQPVWSDEDSQFIPVTEAEMTLSFDHRVLDGGAAGRLLERIANLLQTPETL